MVLLQQTQRVPLETFGDLSEYLITRILTVYFVTDRYLPDFIKSYERTRRGVTSSLRYKIERRDQKRTRQWAKYLKDSGNETELTHSLLRDWSHRSRFANLLSGKVLFVNVDDYFIKLTCPENEVFLIFSIDSFWFINFDYEKL